MNLVLALAAGFIFVNVYRSYKDYRSHREQSKLDKIWRNYNP